MQNKGGSLIMILIASLASVMLVTGISFNADEGLDFDASGLVVEVNSTGIVIDNGDSLENIELGDNEKGKVYINEMVGIIDNEVYKLPNTMIGLTDNYDQIIIATGTIEAIDNGIITIDGNEYDIGQNVSNFAIDDEVNYHYYQNSTGDWEICGIYSSAQLNEVTVKTITRDDNGCMVLNGKYTIDANTELEVDILDIAILDTYQIGIETDGTLGFISYM